LDSLAARRAFRIRTTWALYAGVWDHQAVGGRGIGIESLFAPGAGGDVIGIVVVDGGRGGVGSTEGEGGGRVGGLRPRPFGLEYIPDR
jgi:hypothetical protein